MNTEQGKKANLRGQTTCELVVYHSSQALYCVLMEGDQAVEVMQQELPVSNPASAAACLNRHDLMLGKVRQVLPALNCAFIDIGDDHDALLPLSEAPPEVRGGQTLMVQIRKRTPTHKGHQVTTRLALPGPYAVLRPHAAPLHRSKLRALPENLREDLFQRDLERLRKLWLTLAQEATAGPVPRCLYAFGDPCHMALITWTGPELRRIRVEDQVIYDKLYRLLQNIMPEYLPLLHYQRPQGDFSLAAIYGLTNLTSQLHQHMIYLDQGGSIVLETTEAMTVIDVNSGRDIRGSNVRALRLRTNLKAAEAVARQLRLRNLGGMVVVDFLRMQEDDDRQEVENLLCDLLRLDRARSVVYGFTAMGLFELVRTAI
ncbi:MAG: hypothetical protein GX173_01835 [Ruminococcaceae bacterium]|nr:hypothetical protein [Oscillospiraceae bacterium]